MKYCFYENFCQWKDAELQKMYRTSVLIYFFSVFTKATWAVTETAFILYVCVCVFVLVCNNYYMVCHFDSLWWEVFRFNLFFSIFSTCPVCADVRKILPQGKDMTFMWVFFFLYRSSSFSNCIPSNLFWKISFPFDSFLSQWCTDGDLLFHILLH